MRRADSLRRTSTVDITVDDAGSQLTLRGAARDLATDAALRAQVVATARTRITVDVATGTVSAISSTPDQPAAASLVGRPAGSGFRRAMRGALPEATAGGSLLGLLLDEVPVATVIAGSLLRRRPREASRAPRFGPPADVCAGWARGGLLATTTLATGSPPLSAGPAVTPLASATDPDAWHAVSPLPTWSMRRARRLDVWPCEKAPGGYEIDAFFRDTRVTDDGVERGVHEYEITATVDRDGTIVGINATPRVLPAPECPAAAASAQRLVGLPLGGLRAHVAEAFTGTSTCTHLNDALRALGDLDTFLFETHGTHDDEQVRDGQL